MQNIRLMFQDLWTGITSLAFPRNCALCKQGPLSEHQILCSPCLSSIAFNKPPFCFSCGTHMKSYSMKGKCTNCPSSIFLDHAWFVCPYTEPLISLIHQFKYHQNTRLKVIFSKWMIHFITTYHLPMNDFDCIIPIPLHSVKLRERGYNQALLLAQPLGLTFNIKILDALKRTQPTQSQTHLTQKDRWTNQEGTFKISNPEFIKDKRILLIDDLATSGATSHIAAQLLIQAGARNVSLLTLAKA